MMICEYGNIKDYASYSYEELLELRDRVFADVISYEEADLEENWNQKPGSDYEYHLNLGFLADLIQEINKRFQIENSNLLRAISAGEFQVDSNEGRVSQIKRYTRLRREALTSEDDGNYIDFVITEKGEIEATMFGEHVGVVTDYDPVIEDARVQTNHRGDSYLLLEATCHNKKLPGPGSLIRTEWKIYSNGAYEINKVFSLNWDELENVSGEDADAGKSIVTSGEMDDNQYKRLRIATDSAIWRNTSVKNGSSDSDKWQIMMYDYAGHVIKTSGELDSIEGNKNLKDIVSCLPQEKKW